MITSIIKKIALLAAFYSAVGAITPSYSQQRGGRMSRLIGWFTCKPDAHDGNIKYYPHDNGVVRFEGRDGVTLK